MSWGERSCKNFGNCNIATFKTCHNKCNHYEWNGRTQVDNDMTTIDIIKAVHFPFGEIKPKCKLTRAERKRIKAGK